MLALHGGAARWWARVRGLSPRAILAIGFGLFVLYAFPGYMSSDSVQQLHEARTRQFANPHPPFMAAVWSLLDAIISGPLLMLLLQGTLFLGGLVTLLRRRLAPRAAAVVAVGLLWFPPTLTTMGVIWKDSQMAAYLIAGAAALASERRGIRIAGLALLTGACATRHNAFGAAVPLAGLLFVWRPDVGFWKRYAISGAAAIAVMLTAIGINRALTVKKLFLTPAFADIVGVLNYTEDRTDEDLRHVLRDTPTRVWTNIQATARSLYSARNPYPVDHGDERLFDPPVTPLEREALTRAWKEIIASDWGAYFQYRLASFRELLGLSDAPLWSPVYNGVIQYADQPAYIDHDGVTSTVQNQAGLALGWLATETPLFRPYLYGLLALVLLVLCRDRTCFALLASGLLYELSFFFAGGTPDFRYSHWLIVCACTTAVLTGVRWRRGRAEAA
ncbi:MAG: hypothetical protein H0X17_13280 [Deltaproteobacteria bacterium]|nr:hypothetical protein [Deltaproteobacteria bacterium]